MTKEQSFFLRILSDYLNGRKTSYDDDLDWTVIHQYGQKHQLSGIIYAQARSSMPLEIYQAFRQETISIVFHSIYRDNEFDAVKSELIDKKIPYFVIKGPIVASLFPDPKLRAMGDIDLVVHNDDKEKCHEILLEKGYQCISHQEDREWQYIKNNIELELHHCLVYEEIINEKGHDQFFNDCWKYVSNGQLEWNFHLLFLIFHLRKHFMNVGVGFRMFMDLAIVAKQVDIDWEWLEDNLKYTGMYVFAKKCYGFIERWFGIKTVLADDVEDSFFEEATQKIFADGVFGFDNDENANSEIINQIRKERSPLGKMFILLIRRLFPARSEIIKNEEYLYIDKHKFLLPFAWIHRIVHIKRHKGIRKAQIELNKQYVSNAKYQKRDNMLKKWGL